MLGQFTEGDRFELGAGGEVVGCYCFRVVIGDFFSRLVVL